MSILQARTPNLMEVKLLDYRILINTSVTRVMVSRRSLRRKVLEKTGGTST
jgi:hypothetical protein